jgi:prepilin-type N-terminal cleavage/methylation domain-containing protein
MRISKAGILNKYPHTRTNLSDSHSGFTLIELTVTLLIVSVILGFVLPRIGNMVYSSDLKQSVRQLRAILSVARSLTTRDRIPRRVVCDISNSEIRIEREILEEGDDQVMVNYEAENSILIRSFHFPKGVKIEDVITATGDKETDGEAYLRISKNGMISGNTIHIAKGEERFTLTINPLTGRVSIDEGYIEEFKVEVPMDL